MGKWHLVGLVSVQIAIRTIQYGLCEESGQAFAAYALFAGWLEPSDRPVLNELAKVGLQILDIK
jgi:hypothetical protein